MKRAVIALTNFDIVLPPIEMDQEVTLQRLTEMHSAKASEDRKNVVAPLVKRYGVKPPKISKRRFEAVHFGDLDPKGPGASIHDRALFFNERATKVFASFYDEGRPEAVSITAPDHLIHVTCTGYISPSAAQKTVAAKKWAGKTDLTHAYHMGCYAALPAVRIAEGIIAAKVARNELSARVDIVHTEMCALHMNPTNTSPEQLVVQSLFADGHIKYSGLHPKNVARGFEVIEIREEIIPDSEQDMSWTPAESGMQMTLSRDVPEKIGKHLRVFLQSLLDASELDLSVALKTAIFAVHPGGPKIIEAVEEALELRPEQVQASKDILGHRGNMSSATLPHVWQRLLETGIPDGTPVVSLAFGPGLTIFGSVFKAIDRKSKP